MVASSTNASSVLSLLVPQTMRGSLPYGRQQAGAWRAIETGDFARSCLKGLAHLEALQLAGSDLTDAGLVRLVSALPRLRWLGLAGTRVTDDGLACLSRLPHLTTLVLSGTGITDAGLKHLAQLPTLRTIYLVDTLVTFNGVQSLCRSLPGLIVR